MAKKNVQTILLILTVVFMVALVSCNPSKKYEKEEDAKIQDYLNSNTNLNFVLKPSGLYYMEVVPGSGRLAVPHDTAYVMFTGKFLDGTAFTTNIGTTDTLIIPVAEGYLLSGFDEGITYMKAGGSATLLFPSRLGYGASGYYPYIDGYTPLIFDINLVKVKAGPAK